MVDGEDLINHLYSLGGCKRTAMGSEGVSYLEIESWMNITGVNLTPWEAETIFSMSATYARIANSATNKDAPLPAEIAHSEVDRKAKVEQQIFG